MGSVRFRRDEADGGETGDQKASEKRPVGPEGVAEWGLVRRQRRPADLIMLMHIGLSRLIIASGIADARRARTAFRRPRLPRVIIYAKRSAR